MERGSFLNLKSIGEKLNQFKYPILILLLGVVLLLWPSRSEKQVEAVPEPQAVQEVPLSQQTLQEQMETILSCIDGAGKVRVLLSRKTGDETIYLQDTAQSEGADGAASRTDTAVLAGESGKEGPIATQIIYGQYQGAVVVCQGADRAEVRLELVNAVTSLTGLSADRVTVIKMKS